MREDHKLIFSNIILFSFFPLSLTVIGYKFTVIRLYKLLMFYPLILSSMMQGGHAATTLVFVISLTLNIFKLEDIEVFSF